jgi:hypothetical protein
MLAAKGLNGESMRTDEQRRICIHKGEIVEMVETTAADDTDKNWLLFL